MIQYKLISEYPGSPELGTIDWFDTDESGSSSNDNWKGTHFYNSNPKFWQKVEEVDYEILSFVAFGTTLKKDSQLKDTFCERDGFSPFFLLEKLTKTTNAKIFSVKRLSDGEVFTIGDNINYDHYSNFNKITKISIVQKGNIKEGIWINYAGGSCHLCLAHKVKKTPLFTTEDGKEIFKGDSYVCVANDFEFVTDKILNKKDLPVIAFSTKEKAEEWILYNKSVLSLNDLLSAWGNAEQPKNSPLFMKFEELAKSKI